MSEPRTLNILLIMISANPGVGGLEKHTVELANGLAQAGHRVSVVCAAAHQSGLNTDIKCMTLNSKQSRYNPLLLGRLYRQLGAGKYDVVHAQGTKAAAVLATLSVLPVTPALIASFHGFKSRYPALSRFNAVIAVSNALAKHIAATNVQVVYNGLKIDECQAPAARQLTEVTPKPVWLAVGRLVGVKGFDFLIDSFKHAHGSLFIAGDGPDKALLQQQIIDSSLQNRVSLLGHREDIPALMAACDGIVISSRREGFSYVFAEALLAAKPVISTDVPIANEFLPEQHIMRGVAPEKFACLLNSDLNSLYHDQSEARERARRELTVEAMINATVAVYYDCYTHKKPQTT